MALMCSTYTRDAYKYNNNIWRQVGQIQEDHQAIFYQDNKRIYEVSNEEKTLLGKYTNFKANPWLFASLPESRDANEL